MLTVVNMQPHNILLPLAAEADMMLVTYNNIMSVQTTNKKVCHCIGFMDFVKKKDLNCADLVG